MIIKYDKNEHWQTKIKLVLRDQHLLRHLARCIVGLGHRSHLELKPVGHGGSGRLPQPYLYLIRLQHHGQRLHTVGTPNTPLGLYFKNGGYDETGLGIVGPADHELEGNGGSPLQFIQLDVSSILAQGFTDGKIEIGSVQSGSNDTLAIFGSSSQGVLGQQIGGVYDSSSDMVFLSIADFTSYNFISVGALSGDVLPVAFQATLAPIPEMSALFPIIGLVVAVSLTQLLRCRRIAQSRSGPH